MTGSSKSVYRSYGFWMSLSAAVLLVVQTVLHRLGIQIDQPFVQEIISAVLAVLVILGVIAKPKTQEKTGFEDTLAEVNNTADQTQNNYADNEYLIDKTIDKE